MSDFAKARAEIRGLVLNMPVPFRMGDYAVDLDGLRRNIDWWIEHGVKVIMITAGTSDFASLSEREIAEVTRTACQAVAGRVHLMACTGLWWLGQTVEFARFCEGLGVNSLMIVKHEPPQATAADHLRFHQAIADAVRLPLVYHHYMTGPKSAEVVKRVAEIPAIVAMKQETNDYQQYSLLRDTLGDRLNVIAAAGSELAIVAHFFGAAGSLTGIGQWNPRQELAFVNDCVAHRWDEAHLYLQRAMIFRRAAATTVNHLAIKHMMDRVGLAGGPPRPLFQVPLGETAKARLEEAAREAGLLDA